MYAKDKKKPARKMKPQECNTCGDTQHKVEKVVQENKKISPKEVFGANYKSKSKKSSK